MNGERSVEGDAGSAKARAAKQGLRAVPDRTVVGIGSGWTSSGRSSTSAMAVGSAMTGRTAWPGRPEPMRISRPYPTTARAGSTRSRPSLGDTISSPTEASDAFIAAISRMHSHLFSVAPMLSLVKETRGIQARGGVSARIRSATDGRIFNSWPLCAEGRRGEESPLPVNRETVGRVVVYL